MVLLIWNSIKTDSLYWRPYLRRSYMLAWFKFSREKLVKYVAEFEKFVIFSGGGVRGIFSSNHNVILWIQPFRENWLTLFEAMSETLLCVSKNKANSNVPGFFFDKIGLTKIKERHQILYLISSERLEPVKVSKSQKQFFLKLHCPKNERNLKQNSALWS